MGKIEGTDICGFMVMKLLQRIVLQPASMLLLQSYPWREAGGKRGILQGGNKYYFVCII
jgi:hypothetical protein